MHSSVRSLARNHQLPANELLKWLRPDRFRSLLVDSSPPPQVLINISKHKVEEAMNGRDGTTANIPSRRVVIDFFSCFRTIYGRIIVKMTVVIEVE